MSRSSSQRFLFRHRALRGLPRPSRYAGPRLGGRTGLLLCLFAAASLGWTDEIVLKNGKIIEGTARVTGSRVIVQPFSSDASIVLPLERVETIIPGEAPIDSAEDAATASLAPPSTGTAPPQPAPSHDAANARLTEPTFQQRPALPGITYNFDPLPDPQVRSAVESVFPRIVSICMNQLGMNLEKDLPLNIRIFDDLESFESQKQRHSDIHYAVEGYYAVEDDTIVVWGNEVRQKMVASIYHEATHALLRREYTMVPSWIDEGLAEFFEGFRVQGSATIALSPEYNNGWAKRFLLEGQLLPLDDYLRLTNHQWIELDRNPQNLARITAWSLISFLMETDGGRHALRRYLQAIKRGTPGEAVAVGFQELDAAYPGGIASLERNWRSWILEERKAQTF